jgi:homoaconitase/3-isopropylmalate dehydratase large subunit
LRAAAKVVNGRKVASNIKPIYSRARLQEALRFSSSKSSGLGTTPVIGTTSWGAEWNKATSYWSSLKSDAGAKYDSEVFIDGKDIITWEPEDDP